MTILRFCPVKCKKKKSFHFTNWPLLFIMKQNRNGLHSKSFIAVVEILKCFLADGDQKQVKVEAGRMENRRANAGDDERISGPPVNTRVCPLSAAIVGWITAGSRIQHLVVCLEKPLRRLPALRPHSCCLVSKPEVSGPLSLPPSFLFLHTLF